MQKIRPSPEFQPCSWSLNESAVSAGSPGSSGSAWSVIRQGQMSCRGFSTEQGCCRQTNVNAYGFWLFVADNAGLLLCPRRQGHEPSCAESQDNDGRGRKAETMSRAALPRVSVSSCDGMCMPACCHTDGTEPSYHPLKRLPSAPAVQGALLDPDVRGLGTHPGRRFPLPSSHYPPCHGAGTRQFGYV